MMIAGQTSEGVRRRAAPFQAAAITASGAAMAISAMRNNCQGLASPRRSIMLPPVWT